jgi:hypothetical protein
MLKAMRLGMLYLLRNACTGAANVSSHRLLATLDLLPEDPKKHRVARIRHFRNLQSKAKGALGTSI